MDNHFLLQLALHWNLGEESSNTPKEREAFTKYFKKIDPYGHPVVSHSFSSPEGQEETYGPLLGVPTFDGVSLNIVPEVVHETTLEWLGRSANAGQKWVVTNDEQNHPSIGVAPDADDPSHDVIRKNVLYGNLLAGGGGVEYYYGYSFSCTDLTCQDFRTRSTMWDQSRFALDFFDQHSIPFWDMVNADKLIGNENWCLAGDEHMLVYLREGGTAEIDLTGDEDDEPYIVQWFDPRNGGPLHSGSKVMLEAKNAQQLGEAPYDPDQDWVILLTKCPSCPKSNESEDTVYTGLLVAVLTMGFLLLIAVLVVAYYCRKRKMKQRPKQQNETSTGAPSEQTPVDSLITSTIDQESGANGSQSASNRVTSTLDLETGETNASQNTVLAVPVIPSSQPEPHHFIDFKDQAREHQRESLFHQDHIPSAPAIAVHNSEPSDFLEARMTQLEAMLLKSGQVTKDVSEPSSPMNGQKKSEDESKPEPELDPKRSSMGKDGCMKGQKKSEDDSKPEPELDPKPSPPGNLKDSTSRLGFQSALK